MPIFTATSKLTISDLTALQADIEAVATAFQAILARRVVLDAPDLSQGAYTPAFPALFNVFEDNLRRLMRGYATPDMEEPRVWLGEDADKPRLSYADANRWFNTCEKLTALIAGMSARMPTANAAVCAGSRERQFLRTI